MDALISSMDEDVSSTAWSWVWAELYMPSDERFMPPEAEDTSLDAPKMPFTISCIPSTNLLNHIPSIPTSSFEAMVSLFVRSPLPSAMDLSMVRVSPMGFVIILLTRMMSTILTPEMVRRPYIIHLVLLDANVTYISSREVDIIMVPLASSFDTWQALHLGLNSMGMMYVKRDLPSASSI